MLTVKVEVKYFSMLAYKVGRKVEVLQVSPKLELALEQIQSETHYPFIKSIINGQIGLLVNGRSANIIDTEVTLKNEDKLALIPIMGGG